MLVGSGAVADAPRATAPPTSTSLGLAVSEPGASSEAVRRLETRGPEIFARVRVPAA